MAELLVNVLRDFEEIGLKYTTMETVQTVGNFLSALLGQIILLLGA